MVNLKSVTQGVIAFFTGFIIVLILDLVIPLLISGLTSGTYGDFNTEHSGIVWFTQIIIWTIATLIIPTGLIVHGLTQEEETNNQVFGITASIVYFIFAIALTFFGWFMITSLADFITGDFIKAIFWLGLLLTWTLAVVVAPALKIIHVTKKT